MSGTVTVSRRRPAPRVAKGADGMTIGQAASASGVSAKMIRYYEQEGLLPPAPRTAGNYRVYRAQDVHTLRFVQRARRLGFSMTQLRELLALWHDRARPSAHVKRVALAHVAELERRIAELDSMRAVVAHLATHCAGDARPDCPILEDLAGPAPTARAGRRPHTARRTADEPQVPTQPSRRHAG